MAKQNTDPKSISEAIERLENATHSKVDDFKNLLERDYDEIRKALDELKPHLDSVKGKVQSETLKTKSEVESKIKDNPWITLGAVGLVAFIIGWIFGNQRKD